MLVALSAHPRLSLVLLASAFLIVGGALVWSAHPVPSVMVSLKDAFESRFPRTVLDAQDEIAGIISMGGNVTRVREAVRIAALFPRARVAVSGPGEEETRLARSYGFGPKRLVIEPNATNTIENAVFTKRLLDPKPGERWIVVTSAIHMPRAMGVFAALDFSVEPWPVFDAPKAGRGLAPAVRHEVLGLVAYRLLGHTTAFFPGPRDNIRASPKTASPGAARDIGTAPPG